MSEFRFRFDSVEVEHPVNWRDIEIVYKRDKVFKSLVSEFTSVLEFSGDAYDDILTKYNTGLCESITVDIDWRCSPFDSWSDLIDGEIIIKDAEFDFVNCIAAVEVVPVSIIDRFLGNTQVEVDIGGEYEHLPNNIFQNYDTWDPPLLTATTYLPAYSGAIFTKSLFEGIVNVASDGDLGLVSDLFTGVHTPQVIRVDITSPPAAGETIELQLKDPWGITHIYKTEAVASAATTYTNFLKTLLLEDTANPGSPSKIAGEIAVVAQSTVGGTERFDCTLHFEAEILSFTLGSGTGTATEITALTEGQERALFTSSVLMDMTAINPAQAFTRTPSTIGLYAGVLVKSFNELFKQHDTVYNLGIGFEETTPGNWDLRIDKLEYFMDTTPTLNIRDIPNISFKDNDGESWGKILLGKKSDRVYTSAYDSYVGSPDGNLAFTEVDGVLDCYKIEDCRSAKDFYCLLGEVQYEDFEGNIDIDYEYLTIGSNSSESTANAPAPFQYNYYSVSGGVITVNYFQNVLLQPLAQLLWKKHVLPSYTLPNDKYTKQYTVAGGFTYIESGTPLTVPEGAGYMPLKAKFEHKITKADFDLILPGAAITINQGTDPTDDRTAFIEKLKFTPWDGKAEFDLICKK